jgi:cobalt-zinc-cadmium efflux system membrane fusion protein
LQALALRDANKTLLERSRSLAVEAQGLADVRLAAVERLRNSLQQGFRSQAELQEAEALLQEARVAAANAQAETGQVEATLAEVGIRLFNTHQVLLNLGLALHLDELASLAPDERAERVRLLGLPEDSARAKDATSASLLPIATPLDGIVVQRETAPGELVDPAKTLFVIADVSRLWITLDVRQEDASNLAVGENVIFRPDGETDDAVRGKLTWISTALDERTRTLKARAEVENPDGRLRAGVFGTARIVTRESPSAVAVPTEAIHWEGCCHVVFIRLSDEVFQTRKVRLGARNGPYTEILVGALPGEVVATSGSHVLKSELLKSRLGAGCVDD